MSTEDAEILPRVCECGGDEFTIHFATPRWPESVSLGVVDGDERVFVPLEAVEALLGKIRLFWACPSCARRGRVTSWEPL